jgi:hypothetical protein
VSRVLADPIRAQPAKRIGPALTLPAANQTKTGGSFSPELYADPARQREFARAMTALSTGSISAIAERRHAPLPLTSH